MSWRKAAGRSVRSAIGPFWMGSERQMMRSSFMSGMPFRTIERRLPRENPWAASPTPETQVTPASNCFRGTAITAWSWSPAKPVRAKWRPGSGLIPAARGSARGMSWPRALFGSAQAMARPRSPAMSVMKLSARPYMTAMHEVEPSASCVTRMGSMPPCMSIQTSAWAAGDLKASSICLAAKARPTPAWSAAWNRRAGTPNVFVRSLP